MQFPDNQASKQERGKPLMNADDLTELAGDQPWIVYVFAVVLATAVVRFVAKVVVDRVGRQLERTHNLYDDAALNAARGPIG